MPAEDALSVSRTRVAPLLEPIAGGVGDDLSYDERFEQLKTEVEKLESLAGAKVDWGMVRSVSEELLAERSKDFRLAIYWAAAKAQLDGLDGLLDGLVLVRSLSSSMWETMFPPLKRPRARGNLVGWYADQAGAAHAARTPTAAQADLVAALDETSRGLDGELREKLAEVYPGIGNLRDAVRALVANLPKEQPKPPPPPPEAPRAAPPPAAVAAAPAPAASAPAVAAPSVSVASADDAERALGQLGAALVKVGDALRTADPSNAQAYRVGRAGLWLELVRTPPSNDGHTIVPPPEDRTKQRLQTLSEAGNWLLLLQTADEATAENPLWLDPNRHVAAALDRLGPAFAEAKRALVREVALLLLRAPGLPGLRFSDGTPFADPMTKMWLEAEVAPALGAGGPAASNGSGSAEGGLADALAEARKLAAAGQLGDAVAALNRVATAASSAADRFRGRLALAKLCLEADAAAIARAQLEALEKLVRRHHLDEWDPALSVELYAALHAAHRAANRGAEATDASRRAEREAFERLSALDPSAALRLTSES